MIRRSRTLVALLALLSLSTFIAESAWALVCSPGVMACEAGVETCAAGMAMHPERGSHPAPSHYPAPPAEHSQHAPSGAPACPMAFASGSCAVAALPSLAVDARPEAAGHQSVLPSFDRTTALLVVSGHFRPPRA